MTLEILTSDRLGDVHHGFFTRKGGASSGIFEGLNCGNGSSDQAAIVATNRARVATAMEVEALAGVHQVHSADVVAVQDVGALADGSDKPKADALVTKTPGVALTILTADCQPVLFHDPKAGVIGAAHAGWKGALDGVLEATLAQMEMLGASTSDIHVAIGPTISQKAYEVGQEFFDRFADEDASFVQFFSNGIAEDKYQFDLVGFSLSRLRVAGVADASWIGHCTYSDPRRFFSYRRSCHEKEADYGRLIAAIRL